MAIWSESMRGAGSGRSGRALATLGVRLLLVVHALTGALVADAKTLSQRAGHSSVAFTMTAYMHGDLDADRALAETMARLILPGALGPDGDDEGEERPRD